MGQKLTSTEIQHIQYLRDAGQYALAYSYIAERSVQGIASGTVSIETQTWFKWASHINGHDGTAVDLFSRTFSKMGASKKGFTLTDQKFQEASDHIARLVLGDILESKEIPTSPEKIILTDILEGAPVMGTDPQDFPGTPNSRIYIQCRCAG